jgi:hypothetical protein
MGTSLLESLGRYEFPILFLRGLQGVVIGFLPMHGIL